MSFEAQGRDHEPRNTGRPPENEKGTEMNSFLEPLEGTKPH